MKEQDTKLNKKRLKILKLSKKYIASEGWSDKIFSLLASNNNISINKISVLFPQGYQDLLKLYLYESEISFFKSASNLNIKNLKTNKKIVSIILLRFKKNLLEKQLVKRTFYFLMLPQNITLCLSTIYRTVDNIWYLAGDKSTDYNFYTKRFILACVYYSTLIYWLKITDNNLEKTKKFIEKSIKNTSIIPKLKTSFLKVFTNH